MGTKQEQFCVNAAVLELGAPEPIERAVSTAGRKEIMSKLPFFGLRTPTDPVAGGRRTPC
jgi:hypothetical protein